VSVAKAQAAAQLEAERQVSEVRTSADKRVTEVHESADRR